ncbi:hypothetical protein Moror_11164 [Moniliophthora roreri MCA 2997]|uniref:Uncharacterized protein n=1 Tax=Moniliophthora roreri (strain MCA 2997) TaxID=1381753 RepID=V2WMA3_MONRO|nr:hypothetical protein Moror_11164 [Moniliophthora roreri MCA 2997]
MPLSLAESSYAHNAFYLRIVLAFWLSRGSTLPSNDCSCAIDGDNVPCNYPITRSFNQGSERYIVILLSS